MVNESAQDVPDDVKEIVKLFGQAWEGLGNLEIALQAKFAPTDEQQAEWDDEHPMPFTKKQADAYGVAVRLRVIMNQLIDIHHRLGHILLDRCWENTEVGDEFNTSPPNDLVDLLREVFGNPVVITEEDIARATKAKEN